MKYTLLMLISLSFLAACGVKPSDVQGDPGHPRTYPDTQTDPKP
jgi:hypothetical protein